MPTYTYRCTEDGTFDVRRAIADRNGREPCPWCGRAASAVFVAPALRRTPAAVRGALTSAERSADAPEVVTVVPPCSRATPITRDPRHLRLPRS
ncbi:MAG: zinc ribbon domain-containing protein [Pseudonocardiaceae bacterium]|nr:zinc ribbon domain-containing protein [Pseudonocardiaceae bacterium]